MYMRESRSRELLPANAIGEVSPVHTCRPGEGPPSSEPDPEGRGPHPLVYRSSTERRGRRPAVGDAQQLLNRFLMEDYANCDQNARPYMDALRAQLRTVPLTVDCRFGPDTEKATKIFQACKGLTRDGKIGPNTWAHLGLLRAPRSSEGCLLRDRQTIAVGILTSSRPTSTHTFIGGNTATVIFRNTSHVPTQVQVQFTGSSFPPSVQTIRARDGFSYHTNFLPYHCYPPGIPRRMTLTLVNPASHPSDAVVHCTLKSNWVSGAEACCPWPSVA